MGKMGLLIDYEWCTGCHSCEFACQSEHGFPVGQTGILVNEVGPWQIKDDFWQFQFMATPTLQCDQCARRQALGKGPSCVQHCQAKCMTYGSVEELSCLLKDKAQQCLYVLPGVTN